MDAVTLLVPFAGSVLMPDEPTEPAARAAVAPGLWITAGVSADGHTLVTTTYGEEPPGAAN